MQSARTILYYMSNKKGFTIDEWQEMTHQQLSFLERAVVNLAPFASLSANAMAHLRKDWIEWYDEFVRIEVPIRAPSNSFKIEGNGTPGHPGLLTSRDRPCTYCRNKGSTDGFEHLWAGDREIDRHYTAVLHRELAAPAVDVLEEVFVTYARPEFAGGTSEIFNAAQEIGEERTSDKEYVYSKFVRTGPVLYAEYGLSKRDIVDLTRYTERTIQDIVGATPSINFDRISTLSLLRTLDKIEPATTEELAQELNLAERTIFDRLPRLRKKGVVSVENNHNGPPAATWETAKDWAAPFCCEQCGFETHSLQGIRQHKLKTH